MYKKSIGIVFRLIDDGDFQFGKHNSICDGRRVFILFDIGFKTKQALLHWIIELIQSLFPPHKLELTYTAVKHHQLDKMRFTIDPNIFTLHFLCWAGFLQHRVAAVDKVQISDKFAEDIPDGQEVFIVQNVNHTFWCLATFTGPSVEMRWELTYGSSGTIYDHDDGYPLFQPNSGDPALNDTLGQITFLPYLNLTEHQLKCRVEEGSDIKNRAVVIDIQVPPSNSSIMLFDITKPGGYDPGDVATVTQGETHTFNCTIEATRPVCNVTWTLHENVKTISVQHPHEPKLSDTLSTSMFVPVRGQHREIVKCSAVVHIPGFGDVPSTPVSQQVQLEVNGPPDKPYIVGSGHFIEHEIFQLECRAKDAFPPGDIWWFLVNSDITSSATQINSLNGFGRYDMLSTLTYSLNRQNNQQRMRCEARHQTLTSPLPSADLVLNVKFCPTQVTLSQCPTITVAGNTTTLSCRSTSSNPDCSILWFVNDEPQDSDHNPTYEDSDYHGRITQQEFTSHRLTADDVGIQFRCCANITSDNVCSLGTCSHVCEPDVYYGPVFKAIDVPAQPVNEGEDGFVLSCDVIAKPQPDGFVWWSVDSTKIPAGDTDFDEEKGRLTYYIPKVTKNHAGLYKCVAENRYGYSSSQELPLTVIYKPVLLERNSPELDFHKEGDRVILNATIQANPTADTTWISPTGTVPPSGNERYEIYDEILQPDDVSGTVLSSRLVIKSLSEHDVGKFVCRSNNSIGQLEINYDIKVGTTPAVPNSLQVLDSTNESLTLQWVPGDDGGHVQWFWVSCGDVDKINVNQMTTHTVTGLQSNTQYTCVVYGENYVGTGNSTSTVDITNPSSPDVLGIQIVINRGEGTVSISNVERAGPNICVQLETRFINEEDWDKTGPCHTNDTTENVNKKSQIRATTCSTNSPGKCSAPSSVVEGDEPEGDSTLIIIIVCSSVGVVFLLVVLAVLVFISKRRNGWNWGNLLKSRQKDLRSNSVVSSDSFDNEGEEEKSVDHHEAPQIYVNTSIGKGEEDQSMEQHEAPQIYVNTTMGKGSKPSLLPKPVPYVNSAVNVSSGKTNMNMHTEHTKHDSNGEGEVYAPVSPKVTPDVVPTKLPLKPPAKKTKISTGKSKVEKSQKPEDFQSQLAKALEMRNLHGSDA